MRNNLIGMKGIGLIPASLNLGNAWLIEWFERLKRQAAPENVESTIHYSSIVLQKAVIGVIHLARDNTKLISIGGYTMCLV